MRAVFQYLDGQKRSEGPQPVDVRFTGLDDEAPSKD